MHTFLFTFIFHLKSRYSIDYEFKLHVHLDSLYKDELFNDPILTSFSIQNFKYAFSFDFNR